DRLDERFDRGLALLERRRCVLLVAVEPFAGELQEHLVVALQARACELAEYALQLLAHPGNRGVALGCRALVGLDPRAQQLELDAHGLLSLRAPEERQQKPEGAAADPRSEHDPESHRVPGLKRFARDRASRADP